MDLSRSGHIVGVMNGVEATQIQDATCAGYHCNLCEYYRPFGDQDWVPCSMTALPDFPIPSK